jgi:signal transduction histidine kinase
VINEESDRLRELIDEMMDSSRLQAGLLPMSFQPLRLDTLLREIIMRSITRHPGLKINPKIESLGLQISGDPTRITQVIENVINNAVKYAPASPLDISLNLQQQQARIMIRDYGPGIPTDQLEKIFQRFYRLPQHSTSVRGTGLGLFICRQIIQAHQGTIEAESSEGNGAAFIIMLPLNQKEPPTN